MATTASSVLIPDTSPRIVCSITLTPTVQPFWVTFEAAFIPGYSGISEYEYYGLLKISRQYGPSGMLGYSHYGVWKHYGSGVAGAFPLKNPGSNTYVIWYRPNSGAIGKYINFNFGVDV